MKSLRELYKIGRGPSSSHTMGPERAMHIMRERYPSADTFCVTLYGSLALTGEGHGTDRVIRETAAPVPCEILFDHTTHCSVHPNTMDIKMMEKGREIATHRVYSVGGGSIVIEGEDPSDQTKDTRDDIYELNTYAEIADYCHKKNIRIWQYVERCEGKEIFDYLAGAWEQMKRTIHEGLTTTGTLPGILGTQRRAQILYNQKHIDESAQKGYHLHKRKLCKDRAVLIVDDIMTTGATLDACCGLIERAGASRVYAAAVCALAEKRE